MISRDELLKLTSKPIIQSNPLYLLKATNLPVIRLSETMINQIAAGEVVERPASVVKELMENAIDAGARHVDVVSAAGGKNLIRVTDDGQGIGADDLALAVERHCTSKISGDLLDIRTLGFRGEALPSIGSVSRLAIISRHQSNENAWSIVVDGGKMTPVKPAALSKGTVIEVANLFSNTPARLKFLKSDRAESNAITEIFKRMALAFPQVRFTISGSDRSSLDYPATDLMGRISQVLGPEFEKNALEIDAQREGFRLTGFAGLPTFNRGNALNQYFFVNDRPVRDKSLLGAVRGAYSDFLAGGRHAVLVLFLQCDPSLVDVNVHPAKAEVRFRDSAMVRGLIVGSLKQAISGAGHRASSEGGRDMMAAFRPQQPSAHNPSWQPELSPYRPSHDVDASGGGGFEESRQSYDAGFTPSGQTSELQHTGNVADSAWHDAHPLGAARAQLHENYIIAQTPDGLMIIDQHAAHERIVYEKLKAGMDKGVAGQMLLIPDVIELAEEDVNQLMEQADALAKFGLVIEKFGPGAIVVRETPAMLGEVDTRGLIGDLVDELAEWGSANNLVDRLERVASTIACHGSIRSGRILKDDEMNALLRQMETTPNSGQCNHGRPTYIELKLKDIERLFER